MMIKGGSTEQLLLILVGFAILTIINRLLPRQTIEYVHKVESDPSMMEKFKMIVSNEAQKLAGFDQSISRKIKAIEEKISELESETAVCESYETAVRQISTLIQQRPAAAENVVVDEDCDIQEFQESINSAKESITRLFTVLEELEEKSLEPPIQEIVYECPEIPEPQAAPVQTNCVAMDRVVEVIDQEIEKFSADKIGVTDYALGAIGSTIERKYGLTSGDFRYPATLTDKTLHVVSNLWNMVKVVAYNKAPSIYTSLPRPAETVIDPDTTIGNCWACETGFCNVTVALVDTIYPSAISIDHIPRTIAKDITSAPYYFRVYGIESLPENEFEVVQEDLLGEFYYLINVTDHVQTFQIPNSQAYRFVKFEFVSNHGRSDYTCVYRVRVHGRVV